MITVKQLSASQNLVIQCGSYLLENLVLLLNSRFIEIDKLYIIELKNETNSK